MTQNCVCWEVLDSHLSPWPWWPPLERALVLLLVGTFVAQSDMCSHGLLHSLVKAFIEEIALKVSPVFCRSQILLRLCSFIFCLASWTVFSERVNLNNHTHYYQKLCDGHFLSNDFSVFHWALTCSSVAYWFFILVNSNPMENLLRSSIYKYLYLYVCRHLISLFIKHEMPS